MRLKAVAVAPELIERFLVTGAKHRACEVLQGIPEGARLVTVRTHPNPYEFLRRVQIEMVYLTFEHESFPEVPNGGIPELLDVKLATVTCHACQVGV